jgi:ABC-type Mn2+/Zn2+ transport system permease subunit
MRTYLFAAAIVAIVVGVVHSLLGEWLIFRKLRRGTFVPDQPAPPLQERNVRILWATWHLASAFGFGFAAILLSLAAKDSAADPTLIRAIVLAFGIGAGLVLVGTRGRHPGWIGLLIVAVLTYFGGAA